MESLPASTKSVQVGISRPQHDSSTVIGKGLSLLAQHFRVELVEADFEIYYWGLKDHAPARVEKAFQTCLKEWAEPFRLPPLAEILKRLPEEMTRGKPVEIDGAEEWFEDVGITRFYYRGKRDGAKVVVKMEAIGAASHV